MKTKRINPKYVGSTLEDFLKEEGILEEVNKEVQKRIHKKELGNGTARGGRLTCNQDIQLGS